VITNSETNAQHLKGLALTNACIETVANGVSIPDPIDETQRNHLRGQIGLAPGDRVIGSIGRLDKNKNHSMLLRAFEPLARQFPNLRLLIVGDGPLRLDLTQLASKLALSERVLLPGAIPQAARYLPIMDVCCLTSYTEGMPNVIMEAASAGVPIVSTRCGDSPALIEHGVSGYLVPFNDYVSMSEHLSLLLNDSQRRLRMGRAGREKMQQEFPISVMVRRIAEIYEQRLREKGLR